jgi:hypothetical protein
MTTGKQVFFNTKLESENHHFHLFEEKIIQRSIASPLSPGLLLPQNLKIPLGFIRERAKKLVVLWVTILLFSTKTFCDYMSALSSLIFFRAMVIKFKNCHGT